MLTPFKPPHNSEANNILIPSLRRKIRDPSYTPASKACPRTSSRWFMLYMQQRRVSLLYRDPHREACAVQLVTHGELHAGVQQRACVLRRRYKRNHKREGKSHFPKVTTREPFPRPPRSWTYPAPTEANHREPTSMLMKDRAEPVSYQRAEHVPCCRICYKNCRPPNVELWLFVQLRLIQILLISAVSISRSSEATVS